MPFARRMVPGKKLKIDNLCDLQGQECFESNEFDFPADVYSFTIIMYLMFAKIFAFEDYIPLYWNCSLD